MHAREGQEFATHPLWRAHILFMGKAHFEFAIYDFILIDANLASGEYFGIFQVVRRIQHDPGAGFGNIDDLPPDRGAVVAPDVDGSMTGSEPPRTRD